MQSYAVYVLEVSFDHIILLQFSIFKVDFKSISDIETSILFTTIDI